MSRPALAFTLLLTLSACGLVPTPAPMIESIDEVELIPREALFGNPERANVQISPDGALLSWVAPLDGTLNVWVAPVDNPDAPRAVTDDTGRGIRNYFWSYRPDTLLYARDSGGDENFHLYAVDTASGEHRDLSPFAQTTARVVKTSERHPDSIIVAMNDRDPRWHDLYRVDLGSGARVLIERNDEKIGDWLLDADYTLRYATRSRDDGSEELLRRVGDGWEIAEHIPYEDSQTTGPAGLSADGRTLYFADSRGRDTAALFAIETTTGEKTLLHEDPRADVSGVLTDPRTGEVQAVAVNYMLRKWTVLDERIAADLAVLAAIGPGETSVNDRTLDDGRWIVAYASAETPTAYYRYDRSEQQLHLLFSSRPALHGAPLVPMTPRLIKSRDGKDLVSYLTLPAHTHLISGIARTPAPLILLVHGGPWARDSYGYNARAQWLANRGYAVLSVNYRGSTGFGKAFTNAGDGEWAGNMHDDLIDAVHWAIEQGITTPEQVAIMGGSYGGYATLVGLSFTPDVFACGVDIVGPSNLNTLLATVPPYWAGFYAQLTRRMGDPRTEEGRAWLTERSPLSRAEAIKRPLLIGQGANDPRVKQDESDQIVNAMTARDIPVTYVLFPDEGHGFQRPENSKAFNAVTEGFLGECLGGRVQPIGNDFNGSSITVPVGVDGVPGLDDALRAHVREVRQ